MVTNLEMGRQTIQRLQQGNQVSGYSLQKQAEGMKDTVRSLSNQRSYLGQRISQIYSLKSTQKYGLTPNQEAELQQLQDRYESLGSQLIEARQIQNELIRARNQAGFSPPAEPKPEAKYGYDPSKATYRTETGQVIGGVLGIVRDAQGDVREVLTRQGSQQVNIDPRSGRITEIINPKPAHFDLVQGGINQAAGKTISKEAKKAASGVGGVIKELDPEGQQRLLVQEKYGTYVVTANPAVTFNEKQLALIDKRLTDLGFVKAGSEYVFQEAKPVTKKAEEKQDFFDFTKELILPKSEYGEIKNERFDFTKEKVPIKEKDTYEKIDWSSITSEKSSVFVSSPKSKIPTTESGLVKTPIVEFFEERHTKGIEEFFAEIENRTGLYIKESPVGEIRTSSGIGFLGEAGETLVKVPASWGITLASALKAGEFASREQRGEKVPQEERLAAASEFGASLPYLELTPLVYVGWKIGSAGGKTKAVAVDPTTGKIIPEVAKARTQLVSTEFTKEGIVKSYNIYTQTIWKGTPAYSKEVFTSTLGKAGQTFAKVAAPLKSVFDITKTGVVTGGMTGGMQYGYDVLKGQEPDIERVKRAAIGGFLFGAGVQTFQVVKPTIQKAGQSFTSHVKQTFSVEKALDQAFKAGSDIKTDVNLLKMVARTDVQALRTVPMDSPIFVHADVTAGLKTAFGTKVIQKASVITKTTPTTLPPSLSVASKTMKETVPVLDIPKQRLKQKKEVKEEEDFLPKLGLPTALKPIQKLKFEPIFKSPQRDVLREEAIWEDILREAGTTKTERVEAIRQAWKTGQWLYESETQPTKQKIAVSTGLREKPKMKVGELEIPFPPAERLPPKLMNPPRERIPPRWKLKVPEMPPGILPPPMVIFSFPEDAKVQKTQRKMSMQFNTDYSPSVYGMTIGKIEKDTKKLFTGFGIRGIPRKKKKKKGGK